MAEQKPVQPAYARAGLIVGGIFYTVSGVALFFAPQWFCDNIAAYPTFNRYCEGDLGAFVIKK